MRKRTSFAAILAVALCLVCLSFGTSVAQLFNYTPYPFISINQEDYYGGDDGAYRVPNYLPGGQRYFLVPVFIGNFTDPLKNPNTKDATWKTDDQRIPGVDGQFLVPIRNFEFQIHYANQAIEVDNDPAHGSPIVTVGPDETLATAQTLATPFYIRWTEQSANDSTNPFHRIIRVTGASEVPLPLTKLFVPPTNYNDTDAVLLYIRFRIVQNWTVNQAVLRLDSAKFGDHLGDQQYDPANYRRGNLGGHRLYERGVLPLFITDLPQFEIRPFAAVSTTDNKNYDLLTTLIYDPTDPTLQNPLVNLQIRDAVASTRLVNVNICSDQDWLQLGFTGNQKQHCLYVQKIDYPGSISSDEKNLFVSANAGGLPPGVYYGYITLTADGASNSPVRIKVQLIVRANPDEPTAGGGTGIHVSLTNSCSPTCTKTLVFGSGHGATNGIDLLYGETIFSTDDRNTANTNVDISKRCYAYFEPMDPGADPAFQDPNTLGTIRDIRSNTGDSTLLYKVDFGAGGPLCYPISVCMDPTDFPEGSRVIVRDVVNGSIFSFNMREGTSVGGSRCVYIRDPNITSFIIEYTPGSKGLTADIVPQTWNFLSLPVIPPNPSAAVILPNSTGTPFGYASNAGWTPATNLDFGRGYMVHYGTVIGTDNIVSGVRTTKLSNVRMHAGWNAVGGVSVPVCSDPTIGIVFVTPVAGTAPVIQSRYFEFTPREGYNIVNYLIPGHGYFVKISDEANYNIDPSLVNITCKNSVDAVAALKSELGKVTVRDAAQNAQPLFFGDAKTAMSPSTFEMPPAFTEFDARFTSNNGNISTNATEHVVKIASNNYPVSLKFEGTGGTVEVRDVTGNVIGSVTNNGTVVIRDASIKQVVLALKGSSSEVVNGFSLESSYPNPVSGVSSFSYSIPSETFVTITLTNALGQEMAKLVNTTVGAGTHSVKIDGANLSEGTYFYTIHAGNFTKTEKITVTH